LLASAFFGGKEVPTSFDLEAEPDRQGYRVDYHAGDRTKVLSMEPLRDLKLILFLQDCIISNELAEAECSSHTYHGMKVRKNKRYADYDAMLKTEEDSLTFKALLTSSDENRTFEEQFSEANAFKKLLNMVPDAVLNVRENKSSVSHTHNGRGLNGMGPLETAYGLRISGLNAASVVEAQPNTAAVAVIPENYEKKSKKRKPRKKRKTVSQLKSTGDGPDGESFPVAPSAEKTVPVTSTVEESTLETSSPPSGVSGDEVLEATGTDLVLPTYMSGAAGEKTLAGTVDKWEMVVKCKQQEASNSVRYYVSCLLFDRFLFSN
jgi:hypothetical protein